MYHQCQYKKCLWEVMRTERFVFCMFPCCIEGKPTDPDQEQPDPPGAEPESVPTDIQQDIRPP